MKVRDHLAHALKQLDVTHVFGVGGASIEGLFLSIHALGATKLVLAKHEAAAIHMAEGYFRATGKVGVVLVTSGGGAFNALSPLTEALASDIPLLLIAGQIPSNLEGRGGFQDSAGQQTPIDAEAIFAPVCQMVVKLRAPEDATKTLFQLMSVAQTQRGPVVLLINRDVLENTGIQNQNVQPYRSEAANTSILSKMSLIRDAQDIVIIGGKSVLYEGCESQFKDLVTLLCAKIVLTPDAKGLWDHADPAFAGILGAMGHREALQAIEKADLLISVGTSLPVMSRIPTIRFMQGKTLLSFHHRPSFATSDDQVTVHNIAGSLQGNLALLLANIPSRPLRNLETAKLSYLDLSGSIPAGPFIGLKAAMDTIADFLSPEIDVFVDAGNVGAAAIHYLPCTGRNLFSVALGMGGMGHSFGCSIGSCFAKGRRSIVLAGDGSFFMHGSEIHTAWQYNLPILFIIFNNNAHGMCHIREDVFFGCQTGDNLFKASYPAAGLRTMLPGLMAFEVSDPLALKNAMEVALAGNGPACISLTMSPDEIPPFLPFINHQNSQGKTV